MLVIRGGFGTPAAEAHGVRWQQNTRYDTTIRS